MRSATRSCTSSAAPTVSGRSSRRSRYNRRIYGDRPALRVHRPARRRRHAGIGRLGQRLGRQLLGRHHAVGHRAVLRGELRRLRARARQLRLPVRLGGERRRARGRRVPPRRPTAPAHALREVRLGLRARPLRPESDSGRKHTALGRFRHENTAFRQAPGKPFVLYMGDDKANEGIYRFVSARFFKPGRTANNRRILEEGTLYIARFEPEGRRKLRRQRRHRADHGHRGHGHLGARCSSPSSTTPPRSSRARFGGRVRHPLRHQPALRTSRSAEDGTRLRRADQQLDRSTTPTARSGASPRRATTRRRSRSPGRTTPPAGRPGAAASASRASPRPDNLVFDGRRTSGS